MSGCQCEGLGLRLRNLEQGGGLLETEIELAFFAQDWAGKSKLEIIRVGTPSLGQIGPHLLLPGGYNISVYRMFGDDSFVKKVGLTIIVNRNNGIITMWKSGLTPAFSGYVVINYARQR